MINHWISKRRLKNDEIQKNNLYYIGNDTFDRTGGGRAGAGEAKGKLQVTLLCGIKGDRRQRKFEIGVEKCIGFWRTFFRSQKESKDNAVCI
jgi:hypothetical protein